MRATNYRGDIDLRSDILAEFSTSIPKSLPTENDVTEWLASRDCSNMLDRIVEAINDHVEHAFQAFRNDLSDEN